MAGTVETEAAKQRLHDLAWVVGVTSVDDAAVRVHSEADSAMRRHGQYVPGNDHEILLAVRSEFDKRRAESVASSIRGVSEVQNDLMVKSAVPEPVSDLNSKCRIENRLYWSPLIDDNEITVMVNHGRVTLTGVIDSPNAFESAARIARQAGAKQVSNRIRIRETQ